MIKAIIFDFDGVLVLSEKPRFQVIQKSAANYNVAIPDESINKMVGRTTISFLNDVLAQNEKPLIDKIIEDYEKEYKGNITKYVQPIGTTVEFIKNYTGLLTFALASMSSRKVIEELTKHFGIYEKFKSIICKEDVTRHKPDPEIYLKSAEELHIEPSECAVIEDTMVGVQSALNANMKCFVLLNGFNRKDEFADAPIAGYISTQEDLGKIC
jgi:putative hydrolase of the HAD superfamily